MKGMEPGTLQLLIGLIVAVLFLFALVKVYGG